MTTTEPTFFSRMHHVASFASPYVQPLASKAKDAVYGKSRRLDWTLDQTMSKAQELSALTLETVNDHVSSDVMARLDDLACKQLDRIEALGSHGNRKLNDTYTYLVDTTDHVYKQVETGREGVLVTLHDTVDTLLPPASPEDVAPPASNQEDAIQEETVVVSFTELGTKLLTRVGPVLSSKVRTLSGDVAHHIPSVTTVRETVVAAAAATSSQVQAQLPAGTVERLQTHYESLPEYHAAVHDLASRSLAQGNTYLAAIGIPPLPLNSDTYESIKRFGIVSLNRFFKAPPPPPASAPVPAATVASPPTPTLLEEEDTDAEDTVTDSETETESVADDVAPPQAPATEGEDLDTAE